MRRLFPYIILIALISLGSKGKEDFKTLQLKNIRVKEAYETKEKLCRQLLLKKEISIKEFEIFIRVFKREEVLEIWGKNRASVKFKLLKTYNICASSGSLGPKRKMGDYQVPEGFYYVDKFNPWSNYYLSLGINYPNSSDQILGYKKNLGGDIFIHGSCVTIGCLPMTDDKIKEIYLLTVEAKNNGQSKLSVHIFPTRLGERNFSFLKKEFQSNPKLISFWENLKEGYNYFESQKKLPRIKVRENGSYRFE